MKIRTYSTCVKVSITATLAVALSSLSASAEDEFVFVLRTKGNPYWSSVASGIEEVAKQRGVRATIYQGQTDNSAEEQLNTCLASIQRKPKFLAITAVNTSAGIQCLKKAQGAGISVAELDSSIPLADAESAGVKLAFSVGSDNFQIGKKAAEYAKSLLGQSRCQIVILEGAVGSEPGRLRVQGFKEGVQMQMPQADVIASLPADWDRLKSMNITADLIQRFPTIDLIFAANDQMALGAVEALKTGGKLAQTKVIGVDGTDAARQAIERGELTASVAQVPHLLGKRALELAIDFIAGKHVPQRELTDTPVVTKASLSGKAS